MRKIKGKDIFKIARLTKAVEMNEIVREVQTLLVSQKRKNMTPNELGIEVALSIIDHCGNEQAEKAIFELINDIAEIDNAEDLEIGELVVIIKAIATENDLIKVFKSASQLTK